MRCAELVAGLPSWWERYDRFYADSDGEVRPEGEIPPESDIRAWLASEGLLQEAAELAAHYLCGLAGWHDTRPPQETWARLVAECDGDAHAARGYVVRALLWLSDWERDINELFP